MQFKFNNNKIHNFFFSDLILIEGLIEDLKQEFPQSEVELLLKNNINPKLIRHIFKIKGSEPTEDIIPVLLAFNKKKNLLQIKDLIQYKSINQLREALESLGESKTDSSKRIKDEETTKIYESDKFLVLMPHSTESSCLWGKGTTWCTAATQSGNMFLNYTAQPDQNVVLYYIINKESDPRMDPNAKLSLGFIDGKPVLDGEFGGVSVNAKNNGITEQDLKKILGNEEYNHIMNLLKIHNESIQGKHPAKEEMKNLALDYDKFIKKLASFGDNEDYKNDYIQIILKQENVNDKILESLSNNENWKIRKSVAANENTPEYILKKLSKDKNWMVRYWVADNYNVPVSILEFLSDDSSLDVRANVAQNIKTPIPDLDKLSNDEEDDVRASVAKNLRTPVSILEYLSKDKSYYVRISVTLNPNTPVYVFELLSKDESNFVRQSVALNLKTPISILEKLSNDENWRVRYSVAGNPRTPVSILEKLSKDEYYEVRHFVAENPNWIESRK